MKIQPAPLLRLAGIDRFRGFIMVVMALDHASYFVAKTHYAEYWGVDLTPYASPVGWFTRFITHLCAPGFFWIMGVGMTMLAVRRREQGWSDVRIASSFVRRGLFIWLLMLFVELPAWAIGTVAATPAAFTRHTLPADGSQPWMAFTVLFGLGAAMIVSGVLVRLPAAAKLVTAALTVAVSDWFIQDANPSHTFSALEALWLVPGTFSHMAVLYPVLPWAGVTVFGLVVGEWLVRDAAAAHRRAVWTGLGFLAAFLVLRWLGLGNFQHGRYDDLVGFLTLIKYPPSVDFLLFTLGVDLLLLAGFSKLSNAIVSAPFVWFGQTAMFFYLLHLYLYMLIGLFFPGGTGLGVMYVAWALGLVPLAVLCRWYAGFKSRTPARSIWRLI